MIGSSIYAIPQPKESETLPSAIFRARSRTIALPGAENSHRLRTILKSVIWYTRRVNDDDVVLPGRGPLATIDVSDLCTDGDAMTFEYTDRLGQPAEGFVMRYKGELVAFENRCPHWSVPVGYDEQTFLDPNGRDIVCPMHGARFNAETGECWSGPCIGDGLEKFEVDVEGSQASIRRVKLRIALI